MTIEYKSIDRSKLVPRVRSRFYHVSTQLRLQAEMPEEAGRFARQQQYQVVADHLAVSIAAELPDCYLDLDRDHLESLGLSLEEAIRLAKSNLVNDLQKLPRGIQFESMPEGFYFPAGKMSDQNSSLVLFTDTISKLPLQGDPILFLPHAGIFWLAGSEQTDVLALLCGMTLQELESQPPLPITSIPMRLHGDRWQPWLPDEKHPCYQHVRELCVWNDSMLYEAQGMLLRQVYEAQGRDVHVADYRPVVYRSSSTAEHLSVAVWTETVPTILPKTDYVCLQRLLNRDALDRGEATHPEFGEQIFLPWDALRSHDVIGEPLQTYPQRFLAEKFPAGELLEKVEQEAAAVPMELQHQLRMARRSAATAGATTPGHAQPRSLQKLYAMGCAVGCGGLLFLTLCLASFVWYVGPIRFGRQVGEHKQLFPVHQRPMPTGSDFELGDLGISQPGSAAIGPLPAMAALPGDPLPVIERTQAPFAESGFAGMVRGDVLRDRAPTGGVLVGLRLVKGRDWGGTIRSIQPIYQVYDQYVLGTVLGPDEGVDQIQYLARPGYGVGQIRAQVGLALNAIQLEFHPLAETLPKTAQPYATKWFGSVGGTSYDLVTDEIGNGPVTGIDVAISEEITSIQVVVGQETSPTDSP